MIYTQKLRFRKKRSFRRAYPIYLSITSMINFLKIEIGEKLEPKVEMELLAHGLNNLTGDIFVSSIFKRKQRTPMNFGKKRESARNDLGPFLLESVR